MHPSLPVAPRGAHAWVVDVDLLLLAVAADARHALAGEGDRGTLPPARASRGLEHLAGRPLAACRRAPVVLRAPADGARNFVPSAAAGAACWFMRIGFAAGAPSDLPQSQCHRPPPARTLAPMSRGFLCTLAGMAITIFAWFSPWSWPAWPAFAVLELFSRVRTNFAERSAILVLCIIVNVGAWGLIGFAVSAIRLRWRSSRPFSRAERTFSRAPRPR